MEFRSVIFLSKQLLALLCFITLEEGGGAPRHCYYFCSLVSAKIV